MSHSRTGDRGGSAEAACDRAGREGESEGDRTIYGECVGIDMRKKDIAESDGDHDDAKKEKNEFFVAKTWNVHKKERCLKGLSRINHRRRAGRREWPTWRNRRAT